jgi:hypothetical protein
MAFWLLFPRGRAPGTHLIGGLSCPRASVDALEKQEISCLWHRLNHDFWVVQLIAY